MRAVILNFTGGRQNWGCQATSWNLYRFCRLALAPFGLKQLDIVPFPPGCLEDTLEIRVHGKRLRNLYMAPSPEASELAWMERRVSARFAHVVERVRNADIVFFQGEGSVGPTRYFQSSRLFGLPFVAKHVWKKPVISLNQTLYARSEADETALRNIFGAFDMVALRETTSLEFSRRIGIGSALLCPDMAFCDAFESFSKPENDGEPYFCVTGSAALNQYDLPVFAAAISEISRTEKLKFRTLYSKSYDKPLADLLSRSCPTQSLGSVSSSDYPNYRQIVPFLRNAAFVLGGRYHTSISALACATPVVLTPSNSHKSTGLAALLGIELPVVSPGETERLVAVAQQTIRDRIGLRASIKEAHGSIATSIDDFARKLHRCLEKLGFSSALETPGDLSVTDGIAGYDGEFIAKSAPRGAAKIRSQVFRRSNLEAFDWTPPGSGRI